MSLKPKYSLGKKWKYKISLMGFVIHRFLWILKALWIVLSKNINIWKICKNIIFRDAPENFTMGLCTYSSL